MIGSRSLFTKAVLAVALVASAALAGCAADGGAGEDEVGAGGDEVPTFASYEEAKRADGTVWQANNTNTSVELKVLYPSGETAETGDHDVVLLLYDAESDEPITDAEFEPQSEYEQNCGPAHSFCAEMPAMGHGTSPEESPEHVGHGVYQGMTHFSMSGDWVLNVNPLVDGDVLEYDVTITAEGEGEGHGDMEGGMEN